MFDDPTTPGGDEVPGSFRCDRDERRNRYAIVAGSIIGTTAVIVTAVRVSPRFVVALAGRSQVGRALRECAR